MTWTVDDSGSQTAVIGVEHALNTKFGEGTYTFSVDASALALGDLLELRVYDIAQAKQVWKAAYQHPQISPGKVTPPMTVINGALLTLKQVAGTARTFPWVARREGGTIGAKGLQTNLGSFFSLDNTLADATGNVTNLTNNNGVTFVATPSTLKAVGQCANLVDSSLQYLSHADATGINVVGADFSVQFWIRTTSNTAAAVMKNSGGFGAREYAMNITFGTGSSNPFRWLNDSADLSTINNYPTSVWHHVVFTWTSSGNIRKIYVDGVLDVSDTGASMAPSGTSSLSLGSTAAGGNYLNGQLALFGTWKGRILSASDVALLYKCGFGLSYAEMA